MTNDQESAAAGRKRSRIPYRRGGTQDLNPQSIFPRATAEITARTEVQGPHIRRVPYVRRVSPVRRGSPTPTQRPTAGLHFLVRRFQSSNPKTEIGRSTSDDRHHSKGASAGSASNPRPSNRGQRTSAGVLPGQFGTADNRGETPDRALDPIDETITIVHGKSRNRTEETNR
jgi:hypothetical protein